MLVVLASVRGRAGLAEGEEGPVYYSHVHASVDTCGTVCLCRGRRPPAWLSVPQPVPGRGAPQCGDVGCGAGVHPAPAEPVCRAWLWPGKALRGRGSVQECALRPAPGSRSRLLLPLAVSRTHARLCPGSVFVKSSLRRDGQRDQNPRVDPEASPGPRDCVYGKLGCGAERPWLDRSCPVATMTVQDSNLTVRPADPS